MNYTEESESDSSQKSGKENAKRKGKKINIKSEQTLEMLMTALKPHSDMEMIKADANDESDLGRPKSVKKKKKKAVSKVTTMDTQTRFFVNYGETPHL